MKATSASVARATVTPSEKAERPTSELRLTVLGCLLLSCTIAFLSCTSPPPAAAPAAQSIATSLQVTDGEALFTSQNQDASDRERLAHLWQKRVHNRVLADYLIGPGDILEIAVPAKATGHTEEELREAFHQRLDGDKITPGLTIGGSRSGWRSAFRHRHQRCERDSYG